MALTYTVKRGDSLWVIANGNRGADIAASIAGNTTNAKVETLRQLNGIASSGSKANLIHPGQVLQLSGSAQTSPSGSSTANAQTSNKVNITAFGLQSESANGRDFFAYWSWDWDHTKEYTVQWEWDAPDSTKPGGYATMYQKSTTVDKWSTFTIPKDFQETANWVQIWITPVAETYKQKTKDSDGKEVEVDVSYWEGKTVAAAGKQYFLKDNPPLPPGIPEISLDKESLVLTASLSNIVASDLDATSVKFNIVRDNSTSIDTSQPVTINTTSNYVSWQYTLEPGHTYTVRACSVGGNGKESGWSDFSNSVGTKPSAPDSISQPRRDTHVDSSNGTKTYSVFLEWSRVGNATHYLVEYTTVRSNFDIAGTTVQREETEGNTTSIRIGINADDLGYTYYFRVKAVNGDGESDPTAIVEIPVGSQPAAPTTWSSADSAFVGDSLELNWMHNPTDNSKQTYAQIALKIGDADWLELEAMVNSTDANSTEEVTKKYTYGTAVSYKGELYFKLDTTHTSLRDKQISWKVRTAGVTDVFTNDNWSVDRTIYIYEKPKLSMSMTGDLAGVGGLISLLTSFPFYIRAKVELKSYAIQRPVGYHVQIISNDYYVTVDNVGRNKIVNSGDVVYSKYFDTSDELVLEMSANNIDLESGVQYTLYCAADMSTGLTVSNSNNLHNFTVSWVDVEYTIDADISIDESSYSALITPYCREKVATVIGEGDDSYTVYEDGDLVKNVTLSVYRREYDGSYKEIASGIPNNYTAVTDPHPSLDLARYRFTAKDTKTGALSFWDMAGQPINGSAIIIQWAEEWSTFDVGESTSMEGPDWSGSLLKLPYNIKVTDKRNPEVALVNYAGRNHPVSYYGTQMGETSQWSVEIPKEDKETVYALRRLSMWKGDVYVREPSGMGYWANIVVSFNQSYNDVKIPVTLDITRVEGGV